MRLWLSVHFQSQQSFIHSQARCLTVGFGLRATDSSRLCSQHKARLINETPHTQLCLLGCISGMFSQGFWHEEVGPFVLHSCQATVCF